jgi:hypothetical protein
VTGKEQTLPLRPLSIAKPAATFAESGLPRYDLRKALAPNENPTPP